MLYGLRHPILYAYECENFALSLYKLPKIGYNKREYEYPKERNAFINESCGKIHV